MLKENIENGDSGSESEEISRKGIFSKLNDIPRKSKVMLVLCVAARFFIGSAFSIIAPFYPKEATEKDMGNVAIAFLFSVFQLSLAVLSPLFGNYMTKLGPKNMILFGILVGGTCCIVFGTVDKLPPGPPFIATSFVTRIFEAMGCAAFLTASFAVLSNEFPNHVATIFGILQTSGAFGFMLAPGIGGFLYELGGFSLPFYVIGAILLFNGLLVYFLMPTPKESTEEKKDKSILKLLLCPNISVPMFSISVASFGLYSMEPVLAHHLEPFDLRTGFMSLFFTVIPLVNAVCSPIWGCLSDRNTKLVGYFLVIGHLVHASGYFLIGPVSFQHFIPFKISTVISGLVLVGATLGLILSSAMKSMTTGAIDSGYEDSIATYGKVSGIYCCMYTAGGFTGPIVAGALAKETGNAMGLTVVGLVNIVMGLGMAVFLVVRFKYRNDPGVYEVLK